MIFENWMENADVLTSIAVFGCFLRQLSDIELDIKFLNAYYLQNLPRIVT